MGVNQIVERYDDNKEDIDEQRHFHYRWIKMRKIIIW